MVTVIAVLFFDKTGLILSGVAPGLLLAAAMLDEAGQMNGSVMIGDFPDRAALDAWLAQEPYVTGQVWQTVEVIPCKIGPAFQDKN